MRKVVLLFALVAMMAVGMGAANAHVAGADVDWAFLDHGGSIASIEGTIRCDSGDDYFLRVNVRSESGSTAIGKASGVCTGAAQQWHTSTVENSGTFSCGEPLAGHIQARSDGVKKSISDKSQAVCV
jgi:hypothetical protein